MTFAKPASCVFFDTDGGAAAAPRSQTLQTSFADAGGVGLVGQLRSPDDARLRVA